MEEAKKKDKKWLWISLGIIVLLAIGLFLFLPSTPINYSNVLEKFSSSYGLSSASIDSINYGRKAMLSVNSSLVSANLTDFPVLVTNLNLPEEMWNTTHADAQYNALSTGCDIRFSTDEYGSSEVPFEIVSWTQDNSTGSEIWVKLDISNETDTDFYVWYNESSASCYDVDATYGAQNVWTNDFNIVMHFETTAWIDSANGNLDTKFGDPTAVSTKIGKGIYLDGNDYLRWVSNIYKSQQVGTVSFYGDVEQASNTFFSYYESGTAQLRFYGFSAAAGAAQFLDEGENNVWYNAGYTGDLAYYGLSTDGENYSLWRDGAYISPTYFAGTSNGNWTGDLGSGTYYPAIGYDPSTSYMKGYMDEFRWSSVNRSAQWIKTEFDGMENIESFVSASAPGETPYLIINDTSNNIYNLRVIAMNDSEMGDLNITGTYNSLTPTDIEVRVFRHDTGANVSVGGSNWTTLTGTNIAGGNWDGMLYGIPKTNSWLGLEVRDTANVSNNYIMETKIGVGYVVLYAGQSYIDQWLTWATPEDADNSMISKFRHETTGQGDINLPTYTGWAENTGYGSSEFASRLQLELECPIGILDYGMGGSALLQASESFPYGFWIGTSTAYNWLEDVQEGVNVSEPLDRRKVNAILWYQGYTDGYANVSYADYYAGMTTLISEFENITNYNTADEVPTYLVGVPRANDQVGPDWDYGWTNMRIATVDQAYLNETDNVFFAGQTIDLEQLADDIHQTLDSQTIEGQRFAQSVLFEEVGTGNYTYSGIGPRVSGYYAINETHTAIMIQHENGTDITPTGSYLIDSFDIQNDSAEWHARNATRVSGTLLHLNSTGISVTGLRILYGKYPEIAGILRDNSALALPILVEDAVAIADTIAPTYSGNQTNSTVFGKSTLFSLLVNDETALHPNGQYIFSTNNTGEWINDSAINFTTTSQWANVTKTLNSTVGNLINWRMYLTDNAGNINNTEIFYLTTTSEAPLVISQVNFTNEDGILNGSVIRGDNFTINATVTSGPTVTNVWVTIWQAAIGGPIWLTQQMVNIVGDIWNTEIETNSTLDFGTLNYTVYANDTSSSEVNQSSTFTLIKDVRRKAELTIDHNYVDADLTDFPVLVTNEVLPNEMWNTTSEQYYYNALSDGCDIRFYNDEDGTDELSFELVSWTQNVSNASEIWVKLNLTAATNTTFWVFYNVAGESCYAIDSTYGRESVWSNDFNVVMHFQDTSWTDSANRNINAATGNPTSVPYNIGNAIYLDGNDYLKLANGLYQTDELGTVSFWADPEVASNSFFSYSNNATSLLRYYTTAENNGVFQYYDSGDNSLVLEGVSGGLEYYGLTTNNSAWQFYQNGTAISTASIAGTNSGNWTGDLGTGTFAPYIGYDSSPTIMKGYMDEFRWSSINRSEEWLTAEYDNQVSTDAFTSSGDPEFIENPFIEISSPSDSSYYQADLTELTYDAFSLSNAEDKCWYSIDDGATNSSAVSFGTDFTGISDTAIDRTWTVYCNDTLGNVGKSTTSFSIFNSSESKVITISGSTTSNVTNYTVPIIVSPYDNPIKAGTWTINGKTYNNRIVIPITEISNRTLTNYSTMIEMNTMWLVANDYFVSGASGNESEFAFDTDTDGLDYFYPISNFGTERSLYYVQMNLTIGEEKTLYYYFDSDISTASDNAIGDSETHNSTVDYDIIPMANIPLLTDVNVYLDDDTENFPYDVAFSSADGSEDYTFYHIPETTRTAKNIGLTFLVKVTDTIPKDGTLDIRVNYKDSTVDDWLFEHNTSANKYYNDFSGGVTDLTNVSGNWTQGEQQIPIIKGGRWAWSRSPVTYFLNDTVFIYDTPADYWYNLGFAGVPAMWRLPWSINSKYTEDFEWIFDYGRIFNDKSNWTKTSSNLPFSQIYQLSIDTADDETYWMAYVAVSNDTNSIGIASSTDLINWEPYEGNPIWTEGDDGSPNTDEAIDGYLLWDEVNTRWVLYVAYLGDTRIHTAYLDGTDPRGTYTYHGVAFNSDFYVEAISVLKEGPYYYIFYSDLHNFALSQSIGYARSGNALQGFTPTANQQYITLDKYDWDESLQGMPKFYKDADNVWNMIYAGEGPSVGGDHDNQIGWAKATDFPSTWEAQNVEPMAYSSQGSGTSIMIVDDTVQGNVSIQSPILLREDQENAGQVFRYQNNTDYYRTIFDRSENNIKLQKVVDGSVITINSTALPFTMSEFGTAYHIKTQIFNDNVKVWISQYGDDFVLLINSDDSDLPNTGTTGYVDIASEFYSNNLIINDYIFPEPSTKIPDTTTPVINLINQTNSTGTINGSVTQGDNVTFTVNATDAGGNLDSVWVTIWQAAIGGPVWLIQQLVDFGSGIWGGNVTTNSSLDAGNINYTIYANDTSGNEANASANFTLLAGEPGDSCTYTSGDWIVDCTDNCVITEEVDMGGNDIYITGTGTFSTTANITGYNKLHIEGTDASNICRVKCSGVGCFK